MSGTLLTFRSEASLRSEEESAELRNHLPVNAETRCRFSRNTHEYGDTYATHACDSGFAGRNPLFGIGPIRVDPARAFAAGADHAGFQLGGLEWSVFTAASGQFMRTSKDGINWSGHSTNDKSHFFVAWGGGRFVAVGTEGNVASSADGEAWTSHSTGHPSLPQRCGLDREAVGGGRRLWRRC